MPELDKLISVYISLRDRRSKRKHEYSESDASDRAMQEKIEANVLVYLNELGADSVKTEFGTAYKSIDIAATVNDWDAVVNYVKNNEMWHLLEQRVSKRAVEQFIIEHDEPPPGVEVFPRVAVNIRGA